MGASLLRTWSVAAAVAAGTHSGCSGAAPGLGIAAALAGVATVCVRGRKTAALGAVVLAFGAGALGASLRCSPRSVLSHFASDVPRCSLRGSVLESAGGLGTLVAVDALACDGKAEVRDAGVVVVDRDAGAGAGVIAHGWLLPLSRDDFGAARARLGAHAEFDPSDVELFPPRTLPHRIARSVRQGLAEAAGALHAERAALLRGLTVGDTSGFDEADLERFRRAGLSHLLAVSGSNVAIVLAAVGLATMPLRRSVRIGAAGIALALFVVIVGPEPSVLRAAAMGAIALLALLHGERPEPLHALGAAVAVLLLLRPGMLYSVGLHLSAGATAGIVLWSGPIARRMRALGRPLAAALAATLGAQLAVAPVLIAVFGEVSLSAPVANLLAFPAVAPATVLGLAAGVVGIVAPGAASALARLADPFLAWIVWNGERWGAPSWAAVRLDGRWALAFGAVVVTAAAARLRVLGRGTTSPREDARR